MSLKHALLMLFVCALFIPGISGQAGDLPAVPHARQRDSVVVKTGFDINQNLTDATIWPNLATNLYNGEVLVVYQMNDDVYGQRLDAEGNKIGSRFRISSGQGLASDPDVAFEASTGHFVVVWDYLNPVGATFDWRLVSVHGIHQLSGDQLASPIHTTGHPTMDEEFPRIACNRDDSSCLVVAVLEDLSASRIIAQRYQIGASTLAEDGARIVITDGLRYCSTPDVAFGTTGSIGAYLVVYDKLTFSRHYIAYTHVHGTKQDPNDELMHGEAYLTPPSAIPANDRNSQVPSVAFNPIHDRFLVVYMYDYWGDNSDNDIRGQHVHGLTDQLEGSLFAVANTPQNEYFPALAFAGGETPWWYTNFADQYLVAFIREDGSGRDSVWVQAVYGSAPGITGVPQQLAAFPQPWEILQVAVSGSYSDGRWMVAYDHGYNDGLTSQDHISGAIVWPFGGWMPMIQK
jgi:hypothetical protein